MDISDPEINIQGDLGCNNCISMKSSLGSLWFMNKDGEEKLKELLTAIMKEGKGKKYDSILGLSGGVDSSYLALKAFDWGLRPLVVHVDAGWNSELAVYNIQSILDFTGWDLHTRVINWNEMADLHRSFLRSGISNQDVPQDHAFFASLYSFAEKNKIKYILNGGNMSTEGIFPKSWHGSAMDSKNLLAIHNKFGEKKLKDYPTISFYDYYFKFPILRGIRPVRPLNLIPYNKELALKELEERISYKRYPNKHGESVFTRFFQDYFLINRFGFDKRVPHFSSLIVSGQMSREDALIKISHPLYSPGALERDIDFLCRKLRLTRHEFTEIVNSPKGYSSDFQNWSQQYLLLKKVQRILEFLLRRSLKLFS
jgi:N-acetyl sugar amidotransferase